ncbi:unnamed protein product, partial [Candidula unifasciata]
MIRQTVLSDYFFKNIYICQNKGVGGGGGGGVEEEDKTSARQPSLLPVYSEIPFEYFPYAKNLCDSGKSTRLSRGHCMYNVCL